MKKHFSNRIQIYYGSAKSNKSRAKNAAKDRFGNCTSIHPLHNTIGDAYRHAYFSALNARNSSFGYAKAVMLGYAHECETPNDKLNEKDMDLHNNNWGFKLFPKIINNSQKPNFIQLL